MSKKIYQEHELKALLGDFEGDFDLEELKNDLTEVRDGNRYWRDLSPEQVNAILLEHDRK